MTEMMTPHYKDPDTIDRVRRVADSTDLTGPEIGRALNIGTTVVNAILQQINAERRAKALAADRYRIAEDRRKLYEARKRAKNKSLNWSRPMPEQGNLVSALEVRRIRAAHQSVAGERRSLTAAMLGDPEPHHIGLREDRAAASDDVNTLRILQERARQSTEIMSNRTRRIGKYE